MLESTKLEACYITYQAFMFMSLLHEAGVEDFDLALEITRKVLGDEHTFAL